MPSQRFDEYHHNLSKTKIEKNYFFTIWGDIVLRNCTRSGGLGKVTFSEKMKILQFSFLQLILPRKNNSAKMKTACGQNNPYTFLETL